MSGRAGAASEKPAKKRTLPEDTPLDIYMNRLKIYRTNREAALNWNAEDRTNREAALNWNAEANPSGAGWQEGLHTCDAAAQHGEDAFWGRYTDASARRAAATVFLPGMQWASAYVFSNSELERIFSTFNCFPFF